jgi:hypothetical protein
MVECDIITSDKTSAIDPAWSLASPKKHHSDGLFVNSHRWVVQVSLALSKARARQVWLSGWQPETV